MLEHITSLKVTFLKKKKRITKVESIINKAEWNILQTNFYHHRERLVQVGWNDRIVKKHGGRKEVFEIAEDEQLIGSVLSYNGGNELYGLTWLKM